MKTIVVAAHKGGVGKTMLAAHIAWHFAEQGKRVLALDLDMQANLTTTLSRQALPIDASALFQPGDLPEFGPVEAGGLRLIRADKALTAAKKEGMAIAAPFAAHMRAFGQMFDLSVIDTNAEVSYVNIAALSAATHVITPADMSSFARDGVSSILQIVEKVRLSQNAGLRFLGIVANRFAAGKTADIANLKVLVDTFGAGVVFPAVLRDGNAYKEAMEPVRGEDASGARPIWRDTKPAARSHIEDMGRLLAALEREIGLRLAEEETADV